MLMAQKIHAGSGMWRNISDREMKAMREKEARSVQKLLHTLYNTASDTKIPRVCFYQLSGDPGEHPLYHFRRKGTENSSG